MNIGRNMLKEDDGGSFDFRNKDDIAEGIRTDHRALDAIPDYVGDNCPSDDDIMATERVLKYISSCDGIGFTHDDALLVMRYTTNILRWSQHMERRMTI